MTSESTITILDKIWEDIFPNNIKFIAMPSTSEFPWPLFLNEKEINCAYNIERVDITATLRIWLKENIAHKLYIVSRDHSCYYGLSLFFTDPEDATKFAIAFGDKISKFH